MTSESETLMLDYLYGELSEEAAASFELRLDANADLSAELEGMRACIEMIDEDSAFGENSHEDIPPSHLRDAIFRQETLERVPEIRQAALQICSPNREENTPWIQRMSIWLFGGGSLALGAAVVLFYIANPLADRAPNTAAEHLAKSSAPVIENDQNGQKKDAQGSRDSRKNAIEKIGHFAQQQDAPQEDAFADRKSVSTRSKKRISLADKSKSPYALSEKTLKDAEQRRGRLLKKEDADDAEKEASAPAYAKKESKRSKNKKSMAYDQLSEELAAQKTLPAKKQIKDNAPIQNIKLQNPKGQKAAMPASGASATAPPAAEPMGFAKSDDAAESPAFAAPKSAATHTRLAQQQPAQKSKKRTAQKPKRRGPPRLSPALKKRATIAREKQASERAQNPQYEAKRKEKAKTEATKLDNEIQMILATAMRELNQGNAINALDLFRRAEVKDRTHHAGVIPVVGQMQALEAMKQYASALSLMPRILRAKKGTEGIAQGLEIGAQLAEKTGDLKKATQYLQKLLRYKKHRAAARKNLARLAQPNSSKPTPIE